MSSTKPEMETLDLIFDYVRTLNCSTCKFQVNLFFYFDIIQLEFNVSQPNKCWGAPSSLPLPITMIS